MIRAGWLSNAEILKFQWASSSSFPESGIQTTYHLFFWKLSSLRQFDTGCYKLVHRRNVKGRQIITYQTKISFGSWWNTASKSVPKCPGQNSFADTLISSSLNTTTMFTQLWSENFSVRSNLLASSDFALWSIDHRLWQRLRVVRTTRKTVHRAISSADSLLRNAQWRISPLARLLLESSCLTIHLQMKIFILCVIILVIIRGSVTHGFTNCESQWHPEIEFRTWMITRLITRQHPVIGNSGFSSGRESGTAAKTGDQAIH